MFLTWFLILSLMTVIAAVACVVAGIRRLRRHPYTRLTADRAYQQGRCTTCGFDIRANPKRCPECGDDLVRQVVEYYAPRLDRK